MCNLRLILLKIFCLVTVCLTKDVSKKYSVQLEPLPEEKDYKASGAVYKDGGMGPLFDFARSFIRTSLPGELPIDFVKYVISGNVDIGGLWSQVQRNFLGYAVAIVIGVLFIVIFPIVGCCFCCCRCCGNCGGERNHEFSGSANCHRLVLSGFLFVIATFALVGNICTYVSSERMTTSLEEINSSVVNNLDDINTFLNLTEEQVFVLGQTNLNITRYAVVSIMDTQALSDKLSDYFIETLSGGALATMQARIQQTESVFNEVEKGINDFRSAYGPIRIQCLSMSTSPSQCPDPDPQFANILNKKGEFAGFKNNSINEKIKDGIRVQVNTKLQGLSLSTKKTEVEQQFKNIDTKVSDVLNKIRKFRQDKDGGLDVDFYKQKWTKYSGIALKYNEYRWKAGAGLSAIMTLAISLLILGIIFGFVGNTSTTLPISRGCVSHTGSILLMTSVAIVFIFSSLLMLLTMVLYAVGAPLERYVCQGLDGPNYDLLKVIDDQSLLKDMGIQFTISDVVRSCKEGKTAYVAFHLENSTTLGFNMKDMTAQLDHNKESEDVVKEIAEFFILVFGASDTEEIQRKLNETLKDISTMTTAGMDITSNLVILTSLETSLTNMNVNVMKAQLISVKSLLNGMPFATSDTFKVLEAINTLDGAIAHLETLGNEVGTWKADMENSIKKAQNELSTQKMGELVTNFTRDVFGIVDQYIDFAFDVLENKLGKCTPLWNIYNSVLLVSVCKYTIDAFNGFWFSIGWCIFFFMPGLILAVKLEKYFRKMNSVGALDDSHSCRIDSKCHNNSKCSNNNSKCHNNSKRHKLFTLLARKLSKATGQIQSWK